ncbi:hypothetical protein V491_06674 [Pseudogymnoascus sp. VKM F-3775]|nr:hypothetical protein V491_06674 [Pseudogymnoascus sp. VKM F-3775]
MPSSNSPRDDGASDGANSNENPFVKFRNVVDYHVGSVLQGIIGLPTILSRPPNSGNGRWAEIDSDSRRTPGNLRRQSYPNGAAGNISDEEVKIPVKKFRGQSVGGNDAFGPSHHNDDDDDYDLFSAFNDSFIDHIKCSAKGHPWLDLQPGEKLRWRYESSDDGVQEHIQRRFYASLMDVSKGYQGEELVELQDKSVVPYLLFSPYSPLNLTAMPPLRPNDDFIGWNKDQFTYCDAFEDLLRISAGKPMRDVSDIPLERMINSVQNIRPDWPGPRRGLFPGAVTKMSPADIGMMWMASALVDENILQEDPTPEQVHFNPWFGEIRTMTLSPIALVLRNFLSHIHDYGLSQSYLEETEQDMYERFFAPGSGPTKSSERAGSTVHELLARLQSEGRAIRDVFNNADAAERSKASEQASLSTTHTNSWGDSGPRSQLESTSASVPSSERVVSSSTSTTQHTDEDGTVRTKVVIEKRFEDGRKSVTETSVVQLPSGEKQVQRNEYAEPADGKRGRDNEKKGNGKNKGWFWN